MDPDKTDSRQHQSTQQRCVSVSEKCNVSPQVHKSTQESTEETMGTMKATAQKKDILFAGTDDLSALSPFKWSTLATVHGPPSAAMLPCLLSLT